MTAKQAEEDLRGHQLEGKKSPVFTLLISKRTSTVPPTHIQQDWSTFDQMRMVPHHIVDTDALTSNLTTCRKIQQPPVDPSLCHDVHHECNSQNKEITSDQDNTIRRSTRIANQPNPKPQPTNDKKKKSAQMTDVIQPPPSPHQFPPPRRSERTKTKSIRLVYPSEIDTQKGKQIKKCVSIMISQLIPPIMSQNQETTQHRTSNPTFQPRICKLIHAPHKPDTPPSYWCSIERPKQIILDRLSIRCL